MYVHRTRTSLGRAVRTVCCATTGPDSELLGALCSKAVRACSTKDLVAYKGMQPAGKQYRSERPPEGANDGPEFTTVAETLNTVVTETGTDTLLYLYFTGSARHAKLAPRYRQLAELVAKQVYLL